VTNDSFFDFVVHSTFQGAMRSMEIINTLPLCQYPIQIHIVFVAQQLITFLVVSYIKILNLSTESQCPGHSVDVIDPQVGYVPMNIGLELVSVIRLYRVNPEVNLDWT